MLKEMVETLNLISATHIGIYQLVQVEPVPYQNENKGFLFRHVVPALNALNKANKMGMSFR